VCFVDFEKAFDIASGTQMMTILTNSRLEGQKYSSGQCGFQKRARIHDEKFEHHIEEEDSEDVGLVNCIECGI